jgi:hypothetical protein
MSGFITADGADYLMNLFGGIENLVPEYFVALVTGPVGTAESGDELAEPAYDDYARSAVPTGPENWSTAYGSLTNLVDVTFTIPSVQTWEGIKGWVICDSAEGGRTLFAGDIEEFDVIIGDQVVFPPGSITVGIELDGWRETI